MTTPETASLPKLCMDNRKLWSQSQWQLIHRGSGIVAPGLPDPSKEGGSPTPSPLWTCTLLCLKGLGTTWGRIYCEGAGSLIAAEINRCHGQGPHGDAALVATSTRV